MIIYEVNLNIAATIFDSYLIWLTSHVRQMLHFDGFQSARYLSELSSEEGFKKFTVQYEVDTLENLQHYLDYHANSMREEGVIKFSNQFSATRRIFEIQKIFYQEQVEKAFRSHHES